MKTGYNFATRQSCHYPYTIKKAKIAPGKYRKITGNEAPRWDSSPLHTSPDGRCSMGRIQSAASDFCTSSRATRVLSENLSGWRTRFAEFVRYRASFAGQIGLTGLPVQGGPEAGTIGLAVMTELPLVIVKCNARPINRITDKDRQPICSRLLGRMANVRRLFSPGDTSRCFHMAIEAVRLAFKYMTPVFIVSTVIWQKAPSPGPFPNRINYRRLT